MRLNGQIIALTVKTFKMTIRSFIRKGVKTVILFIDCGGGLFEPSVQLAEYIFGKRDVITVIAVVFNYAASRATIVLSACAKCYVSPDAKILYHYSRLTDVEIPYRLLDSVIALKKLDQRMVESIAKYHGTGTYEILRYYYEIREQLFPEENQDFKILSGSELLKLRYVQLIDTNEQFDSLLAKAESVKALPSGKVEEPVIAVGEELDELKKEPENKKVKLK